MIHLIQSSHNVYTTLSIISTYSTYFLDFYTFKFCTDHSKQQCNCFDRKYLDIYNVQLNVS